MLDIPFTNVGQRFATCPAMLDIFRKNCWTTRPTMFDSLAKPLINPIPF